LLFKVNMYRLGREKRREAQMRIRRFASMATLIAVNIVVVGLFVVAVALAGRGIEAREVRLEATQAALAGLMEEQGGDHSDEDLELVRTRVSQVRWSVVLEVVARLTPRDMYFPRLMLAQGTLSGSRRQVWGLHMSGRLHAVREEEGLSKLMEFVGALREDASFKRYFREPKLTDSSWVDVEGTQLLEFEIFCPLSTADAILEGALDVSGISSDMVDPDQLPGAWEASEEARASGETSS
jgi:hypothetical protein